MSAAVDNANFQAQVESVLCSLVKVATAELTKLFESRYRAAFPAEAADGGTETLEALGCFSCSHRKLRSVGVQVDEGVPAPSEGSALLCSPDGPGDYLIESIRLKEEEEDLSPFPGGDDEQYDAEQLPLTEKEAEMVGAGDLDTDSPTTSETETKTPLTLNHDQSPESQESVPAEYGPFLAQPEDACQEAADDAEVHSPVSPVQKTEPLGSEPEDVDLPAQVEPQSTDVSAAYTSPCSEEAVASLQLRVWERIDPARENNPLQLKLKRTPVDQETTRPCSVQLVDLLAVSKYEHTKNPIDSVSSRDANGRAGLPVPRELRRHQGLHTGHRLCCFTRCDNGIWRLQRIVTHSRDGYACNSCGKKFKRRKILRRHERFHTGEKPYSCSQCSKTFALRKSLRRHQRFHTGERPHSCPQCGKSFRLRDNLKAHLRFHTGEKPFICQVCGKSFRISRNLQKHNQSACGILVPSFRKIAGL